MRRSASEMIRNLEMRIALLEKKASTHIARFTLGDVLLLEKGKNKNIFTKRHISELGKRVRATNGGVILVSQHRSTTIFNEILRSIFGILAQYASNFDGSKPQMSDVRVDNDGIYAEWGKYTLRVYISDVVIVEEQTTTLSDPTIKSTVESSFRFA